MQSMIVRFENEEGEEITLTLPCKKEVCPECDGSGFVLCGGMRSAVYTAEEFAESFDDEEREEYFRPGGRYDETCDVCHGKNVIDVVDEEHVPADLRNDYERFQASEERRARYDAEDRATYHAECGYRE